MIEALKSDDIVQKVGGRFKLTALIQKRMLELMDGARPLVDRENMTDLEVVVQEILQDKIAIDYAASGLNEPRTPEELIDLKCGSVLSRQRLGTLSCARCYHWRYE